jgi:hypothetical protein
MVRPVTDEYAPDGAETVEALEQRVRRLENAVAALQDTQLMEDRVVERVVHRLDHAQLPLHESSGLIVDAARMLLPKTVEAVPEAGTAPQEDNGAPAAAATAAARPTWLLLEVFREFRAILRMLTDYRYRMTWTGRIVPLVALGIAFFSWVLIGGRFLYLGDVIDKAIDVVLAVVVYKVYTREVHRYHELLARVYRYR